MLNSQLKQEGYKVLDLISFGAQGRVYKLVDRSNNLACIKIQSLNDDIDREIEIIKKLHTSIPRDFNQMSKYKRFLLRPIKYLENIMHQKVFIAPFYKESLYQRMKRKKMCEAEVRIIAVGLCQVLCYMHARGIAHRDIKPSNIMLDANDKPILIDFGCADHYDIKMGTTSYYAPEQLKYSSIRNDIDTTKFDVWSLGQVLYECLDDS